MTDLEAFGRTMTCLDVIGVDAEVCVCVLYVYMCVCGLCMCVCGFCMCVYVFYICLYISPCPRSIHPTHIYHTNALKQNKNPKRKQQKQHRRLLLRALAGILHLGEIQFAVAAGKLNVTD